MAQIKFDISVDEEDGMLWGQVKQLPGCFASGANVDELQDALLEAIQMCLPEGIDLEGAKFISEPEDPPSAQIPRRMLVCA